MGSRCVIGGGGAIAHAPRNHMREPPTEGMLLSTPPSGRAHRQELTHAAFVTPRVPERRLEVQVRRRLSVVVAERRHSRIGPSYAFPDLLRRFTSRRRLDEIWYPSAQSAVVWVV